MRERTKGDRSSEEYWVKTGTLLGILDAGSYNFRVDCTNLKSC